MDSARHHFSQHPINFKHAKGWRGWTLLGLLFAVSFLVAGVLAGCSPPKESPPALGAQGESDGGQETTGSEEPRPDLDGTGEVQEPYQFPVTGDEDYTFQRVPDTTGSYMDGQGRITFVHKGQVVGYFTDEGEIVDLRKSPTGWTPGPPYYEPAEQAEEDR